MLRWELRWGFGWGGAKIPEAAFSYIGPRDANAGQSVIHTIKKPIGRKMRQITAGRKHTCKVDNGALQQVRRF